MERQHLKCQAAIAKETRGQKVKRFERMQRRVAARPDPKIPTMERPKFKVFQHRSPSARRDLPIAFAFQPHLCPLVTLFLSCPAPAVSPHLHQSSPPPFPACKKPKKLIYTGVMTRAAVVGGGLRFDLRTQRCSFLPDELADIQERMVIPRRSCLELSKISILNPPVEHTTYPARRRGCCGTKNIVFCGEAKAARG